MAENTETKPLTPADYQGDIKTLESLLGKYELQFKQGAHIITAAGAIRTVVANLQNHISALNKAAEKKAEPKTN